MFVQDSGLKILITAGPTREFIDPARFISNPSTGKMGYALAQVAQRRGHQVLLISGPVGIRVPRGVRLVKVVTAEEMLKAVKIEIKQCDVLIMAAAVADWRPATYSRHKLKKEKRALTLKFKPTADILKSISSIKGNRIVVGFAAETDNLLAEARRKLRQKGLDLVVANDIGRKDSGFEVDTNQVTLISSGGMEKKLPLMPKTRVAARIISWIEKQAAQMKDFNRKSE